MNQPQTTTAEHIQHLDEHGYAVFPEFLDLDTTARIREHIDQLLPPVSTKENPSTSPKVLRHPIEGDIMVELLNRPELIELARQIIKSESIDDMLLLEQVLIRTDRTAPPYGPNGWHVDMAFLPDQYDCTPRKTYYHMVHLCNTVQEGAGSFMIVPGSHHTNYSHMSQYKHIDDASELQSELTGNIDSSKGIEITGNEGDLVVFNPMCLHSASGNASDQPRYVYFASFMDKSATYLRQYLKKEKTRDNFPDSLKNGLPDKLKHVLD
ncbi:phytanoyl-CoA dioxygenase family protein [bacterium AH-315-E10]|nr:phytanoyl-CoA dioxygenase family protein [bacterium AH-315-E10]